MPGVNEQHKAASGSCVAFLWVAFSGVVGLAVLRVALAFGACEVGGGRLGAIDSKELTLRGPLFFLETAWDLQGSLCADKDLKDAASLAGGLREWEEPRDSGAASASKFPRTVSRLLPESEAVVVLDVRGMRFARCAS